MASVVQTLFGHYRAYHEMNRAILQWIGVVGFLAYPSFYLLRRFSALPPLYDDLILRVVATIMCLLLALRNHWPQRLKPYYLAFSYAAGFYCVAFLLSFTMLKNHGGLPSLANMVMGSIIIILMIDWRNSLLVLVAGYALSLGVFWLTEDAPRVPPEFVIGAAGSILVIGAGAVSRYGQQRGEQERLALLYAGLAGSIAHELRNPLTQAGHALDLIAGELRARNADALLRTVEQGRHAIDRGLQAIALTLQQLRPGALDSAGFKPLSAGDCVRAAVQEYAYDDEGQRDKVKVVISEDFIFRGDQTALVLILFNLLKNALYYAPLHPSATVTIKVEAAPEHCIVVRDTGPGIAPALMPRLFQDFQTAGKSEGTGLGLAFCRRVMQAFGGDIRCRSELGAFTEFTLTFPACDIQALQAPAQVDGSAQATMTTSSLLAGRTVLVVDDQALNRAIARLNLQQLGMQVAEAEHGQQALDMLQAGVAPDAILMDINMPGLNGLETTRALRTLPAPAGGIPVLAITGNGSSALAQAALDAGLQGVLTKPIDVALLAAELSRVLSSQAPLKPIAQPQPRGAHVVGEPALLDLSRIDGYERAGLLQDLLPEALAEMQRLANQLAGEVAAHDRTAAENSLHSLLGISGEAGAQALYECTRRHYVTVLHGQWPEDDTWVVQLQDLARATQGAMNAHYGVPAAG